ncbi:SDR family NAD(P)-dependent oxidoreductase [Streptomyces sp. DH8]|uniref:SDR family NAD(P)-dependent oxidoreductase n=1 Tax=Streptomyces sp. DH8 TaxID=2857008 RepID=UPI001E39D9BC|nr:SDR family oxidoreductase [Streptomyces sp. DH8]
MDLSNQTALVTGGGRGIGREIAVALASAGARVTVIARDRAQLAETAALADPGGARVHTAVADVTDEQAVGRAVAEAHRRFGPATLLVNNAGGYAPDEPPLWEADLGKWWRTVEVNLFGTLVCSRAVLPAMLAAGRGRIISVGSDGGVIPMPLNSYSLSKNAVVRLTEALSIALAEQGGGTVRTFAVNPGLVRTAMTEQFVDRYPDTSWTPVELSGRLVVKLASGAYDALAGRYLAAEDDLDLLMERIEDVEREELYVQRLRRFAPDGSIESIHWPE